MKIARPGFTPSPKGPAAYFTGSVRIDCPFCGSGNLSAATVTFEPGARTAWHTHPLDQTLLVTAGFGLVGRWGGKAVEWIEHVSDEDYRGTTPLHDVKEKTPCKNALSEKAAWKSRPSATAAWGWTSPTATGSAGPKASR